MRAISASGHLQLADLLRLAFDEHRAPGIEAAQLREQQALEPLLRGLRPVGQVAEHRAAVRRESLQVEHLRAGAA